MLIGEKSVDLRAPTYIIAEAGISHNGDVEKAKRFAWQASKCGADAIKFQYFHPEEPLFCPWPGDEDRWRRWKKSAMTFADWKKVKRAADANGIHLILSVFQPAGISLVQDLQLPAYKVASRAAMRFPYEKAEGPFIISTGAMRPEHWQTLEERIGSKPRVFLQCRMDYPHDPICWQPRFHGISDHSGTIWPALDAIVRGGDMVEVHVAFTDQNANDAAVSIAPEDLKLLCEARDAFAVMRED